MTNEKTDKSQPMKPGAEKASWLDDPTDDEIYQMLDNDDIGANGFDFGFKAQSKQQNYNPGNGIDRASYHPVDERFVYQTAPDWNDDASISLPEVWVRAHPFGNETMKDAHGEYFDKQTDFHEKDTPLPNLPVTYYHNFNPDGTPKDKPSVIGKSIARKYLSDGRWDKLHFYSDKMKPDERRRIAKAIRTNTLRASPSVIPDIHKVNDESGHIDDWATGSIAVLDAEGERQPASARAIGIPAMKALFKAAQIPFPKNLGGSKMGNTKKTAPSWKAQFLKAIIKALGEVETNETHSHPDGSQHANHVGSEQAHEHDETGALKALETQGQNLVDDTSSRARFEGADLANVSKDVNPMPDLGELFEEAGEAQEQGNALKDPEVQLDWKPEEKRAMKTMKARIDQLEAERDGTQYESWFVAQLQAGKVLPAERDELRLGYLQALIDDRTYHPVMKSQGKAISRLSLYKNAIERRESRFGERQLTANEMKALGYQFGGVNQTSKERAFDEARRQELLNASPLGQKITQETKK